MAVALAGATALRGGHEVLLLVIGAAALPPLLAGLALRWSAPLALAVTVLGAQLGVRLGLGSDALDASTPLAAGTLLLVAELAWWSIERRVPAWPEPWLAVRRAATVLSACIGGAVAAAFVLLVAASPVRGGVGLELVGVVAAVGALGVLAWLARERVR